MLVEILHSIKFNNIQLNSIILNNIPYIKKYHNNLKYYYYTIKYIKLL